MSGYNIQALLKLDILFVLLLNFIKLQFVYGIQQKA